jgi:hypothetical protein
MPNNDSNLGQQALIKSAFERVLPELLLLPENELRTVALDIPAAVITVYGTIKEVMALRPQLAELSVFDISQVDKLKDYARALSYIHGIYLAATTTPEELESLAVEAATLRERYLSEVRWLTHHGVVHEDRLKNLKGANGRKNIAVDLNVLVGILQSVWPQIEGKTLTSSQDLEHASSVSTRVQELLGDSEQGPAVVAEVTDQRVRAYTKLMDVYESIQRAVAFLRGAKYDADTIVPTLFKGGRPASRTNNDETTVPGGDVTPPVAGVPSAGGAAPTAPSKPAFAPDAFGPTGPFMPVK